MASNIPDNDTLLKIIKSKDAELNQLKIENENLKKNTQLQVMQMRLEYLFRICSLKCFEDTEFQRSCMLEIEQAITITDEHTDETETSQES